jgi:hypothetical protein
MQNILRPAWLLFINTLPVALMAWIYYSNYRIIESLLSPETIALWIRYGVWLGVLWIIHLVYALILLYKKRILPGWYGAAALALYIPLLYLYYAEMDAVIPRDIPAWMIPEDISIYVGTFIMPTLAHALFVLVVSLTHRFEKKNAAINFLLAALIPITWYLFFQVLLPFWKSVAFESFGTHVMIIVTVCGTVLFLFFLVRCVYILFVRQNGIAPVYQVAWKVVLGIIFPVLGLIVNAEYNAFGDFNSHWFYILAVVNGIAITIPNPKNKRKRFALFAARSITFSFIVYFFVVFLPYLPLSVIAIVAIGTGFLMLTPLALMIVQTNMMADDFRSLAPFYPKKLLMAVMLGGFCVLPLIITIDYRYEKYVLTQALDHVYAPELGLQEEKNKIDPERLSGVLQKISDNKRRRRDLERKTPFLSTYYNWLVLDNVTLSDDKIGLLKTVFTGEPSLPGRDDQVFARRDNVRISNITTHSVYDEKQQAYKSEIALDITNNTISQAEFATAFELPEGCWISNYYLWIENEKVYGLLAEKKAATWIYQQITSYRRDPGILYYLTGNKIALRVFPLESAQTRKTGFEVLHKEPVRFQIGQHIVALGDPERSIALKDGTVKAGKSIYLSPEAKKVLPPVSRAPRDHFIIDCSAGNENLAIGYISRIENYARENGIDLNRSRFLLTNAYTDLFEDWSAAKENLKGKTFEGGFFLERSLQKICVDNYRHLSPEYPRIVVVTDSFPRALFKKDLRDLHFTFPESDIFYELTSQSDVVPHSLIDHPTAIAKEPLKHYAVAAWPNALNPKAYVRLDDKASIVLDESQSQASDQIDFSRHHWGTALALHGEWLAHVLHPEKSDDAWRPLVKKSFQSQIMTPVTSFISLENDAQRKALLKKQEELLNAKSTLDAGEETRMSEPGMFLIGIVLALFIARNRIKGKKVAANEAAAHQPMLTQ